MTQKIQLNESLILNKVFKPNVKGYDANEVDDFLDLIRNDYVTFSSLHKETLAYIADLEDRNAKLSKKIQELELSLSKARSVVDGISSAKNVTSENLQYIQRISKLEEALFKKGIDATKIK